MFGEKSREALTGRHETVPAPSLTNLIFPSLVPRSPSAGENESPGIAARCETRIEGCGRGRCLECAEQWKVLIRGEQDCIIRRSRNMHFRGIHEWNDSGKSSVISDAIGFVVELDKLSVKGSGVPRLFADPITGPSSG